MCRSWPSPFATREPSSRSVRLQTDPTRYRATDTVLYPDGQHRRPALHYFATMSARCTPSWLALSIEGGAAETGRFSHFGAAPVKNPTTNE